MTKPQLEITDSTEIVVFPSEGRVSVDGEGYKCLTPDPESNDHCIRWKDGRGVTETKVGDNTFFDTSDALVNHIRAWEAEKYLQQREAEKAEEQKEAAEAEKRRRNEKANADFQEMKPMIEALELLEATDHEVIKALESGKPIDPDIKAKREAARRFIIDERANKDMPTWPR